MEMEAQKRPFYAQTWFMVLMLILFAPVGIFLLWRYSNRSNTARIAGTVLSALWFLIMMAVLIPGGTESAAPAVASESPPYSQTAGRVQREESTTAEPATEVEATAARPTTPPETTTRRAAPPTTEKRTTTAPPQNNGQTYILNTNTKKYHRKSCPYAARISPKNYATSATVPAGYSPCGHCNP